ncbi:MAG TPA: tetratricopeptide repeat protein [Vicinamibacterales bacterium]|nr:tetratricopeptide repeat protein [Vicinamibacterales bacterium]
MAFDREDTLKKAEKLLRQGRLEAAIAEYARVVDDQPRDWTTTNTLGDLYARAGQADKAAGFYGRIAEHLMNEGFYPKSAAIYKKILKIKPDDEGALLNLAELSARQGLLADAKTHFGAVAERRRARGDRAGLHEIVVRLGSLDLSDIDARLAAARVLAEDGDGIAAAIRYRELHADLIEKGRQDEAIAALREAVRLNPDDKDGRGELARAAVAAGDYDAARQYLDRETAAGDPALLLALINVELRSGALEQARDLLPQLLALDAGLRHNVVELAWTLAETSADAAFVCIDTAVDASIAAGDHGNAAGILQELVTRLPNHVPALLKLVEVCVDGGLEAAMYEAQAQLADAYLGVGQAAEARVIAEDLVAREPWERAHIDRFRRALVMLKVSDPDTLIAERLSGQAPFTATDPFAESMQAVASPAPPVPSPAAVNVEPEEPPPSLPTHPAPAPVPPPPSDQKPAGPVEIDLTRLLGDLQGTPTMPTPPTPPRQNLDEVFQDFRTEVSRHTGAEEAAQQLKLARTYLEMGMTEEAVTALAAAARSPRHRFEAAGILGRLYRQRNDIPHAVEWLERAAEAPAPGVEEGRSLLYDLGTTLEGAGETARALAVFLELQADAEDYRDVAARVDRLARVQAGG